VYVYMHACMYMCVCVRMYVCNEISRGGMNLRISMKPYS
jgi:hypothetical protein